MASVQRVSAAGRYRSAIREILAAVDDEFVPPLTGESRQSMSRSDQEGGHTDLDGYVGRCVERPLIGGIVDEELVGFLSFEPIERAEPLGSYTPTNHVEIVAVHPDHRGQGLATAMYRYLLEELADDLARPFASTKTWESNSAHIGILEQMKFELVHRIPDDRKPGLDTVYYAREV